MAYGIRTSAGRTSYSRDSPVAAQRMGEELIKQAEAIALFPAKVKGRPPFMANEERTGALA